MLSRLAGSLMAVTRRLCAAGDSSSARRKQRPMRPYPLMARRYGLGKLIGGLGLWFWPFLAFLGRNATLAGVVMHLGDLGRIGRAAALVAAPAADADVGVEDHDALPLVVVLGIGAVAGEIERDMVRAGAEGAFGCRLAENGNGILEAHAGLDFGKAAVGRRIAGNDGGIGFVLLFFGQHGRCGKRQAQGGEGDAGDAGLHLHLLGATIMFAVLSGLKQLAPHGRGEGYSLWCLTWRSSRRERRRACGRSNPTRCRTRPEP